MEWSTWVGAAGLFFLTILGAEWTFISWLSRQFTRVYAKMDELVEKIMNKLEYHQKHDDSRFNEVRSDIWELRLRNASADDYMRRILPKEEKKED